MAKKVAWGKKKAVLVSETTTTKAVDQSLARLIQE